RARVEAGETQSCRDCKEKGGEPTEPIPKLAVVRDALDAPLIHHDRRRKPERDHVAEAVVLLAEVALRLRPPSDAAVEPVEQHRDEYADPGAREVAVDRGDDRIEPAEQGPGREQVRQPI